MRIVGWLARPQRPPVFAEDGARPAARATVDTYHVNERVLSGPWRGRRAVWRAHVVLFLAGARPQLRREMSAPAGESRRRPTMVAQPYRD